MRLGRRRDKIMDELLSKTTRLEIETYKQLRQDELDRISKASPGTGNMLEGLFMTALENAL